MSSFQLQALPTGATTALSHELATAYGSAFLGIQADSVRNIISNDGAGRMHLSAEGREYCPPTDRLLVVIAGFEHNDFDSTRRQYYKAAFGSTGSTNKEAPDCFSDDGITVSPAARNPQAASCVACPHYKKDDNARYGSCQHKKHFLLYLVETNPDGSLRVNTSIPFSFAATSVSMFTPINDKSSNGGTHKIIPFFIRKGAAFIDRIVFEMDYSGGPRAPLFRPVGTLPDDIARDVTLAAKTPDAYRAIYKDANGVPVVRKAAPAQPAAQAYTPPVQAVPPTYVSPAPMYAPVVQDVAPPVYTPPPAPPVAAPVFTPPPVAAAPMVVSIPPVAADNTALTPAQQASVAKAKQMVGFFQTQQ
jgi:hypothetical protein